MTEMGSGADTGECLEKMDYQVRVDWWMKLFSLFTRYIEHRKLPGWAGFLPFYRLDCPIHGEVENYPHGYEGRLECPKCQNKPACFGTFIGDDCDLCPFHDECLEEAVRKEGVEV